MEVLGDAYARGPKPNLDPARRGSLRDPSPQGRVRRITAVLTIYSLAPINNLLFFFYAYENHKLYKQTVFYNYHKQY